MAKNIKNPNASVDSELLKMSERFPEIPMEALIDFRNMFRSAPREGNYSRQIKSAEDFKTASLDEIGGHYCTDKSYPNRTAQITYLEIYEMYFQKFKEAAIDMVEIGVRRGESINTWNKYFTNANSIYGIDINETWWESLLFYHIH